MEITKDNYKEHEARILAEIANVIKQLAIISYIII